MKNKVIISVAPVSAVPHAINTQHLAQEITDCAAAGASMVHLHVRDHDGRLTKDVHEFAVLLDSIRTQSNIVLQASTGGISKLTIEERCAPLGLSLVETCSLNVGSVNLGGHVYMNPPEDVKYCVQKLLMHDKIPEVEIFEIGMVEAMRCMQNTFTFKAPLLYNLVLGHEGAAPATAKALTAMWQYLDPQHLWGFTQAHRTDFSLMACALGLGARLIRIGHEDSPFIAPEKKASNAALVAQLAILIRAIGLDIATPDEARHMMGVV